MQRVINLGTSRELTRRITATARYLIICRRRPCGPIDRLGRRRADSARTSRKDQSLSGANRQYSQARLIMSLRQPDALLPLLFIVKSRASPLRALGMCGRLRGEGAREQCAASSRPKRARVLAANLHVTSQPPPSRHLASGPRGPLSALAGSRPRIVVLGRRCSFRAAPRTVPPVSTGRVLPELPICSTHSARSV